jgi:hypothetical protein
MIFKDTFFLKVKANPGLLEFINHSSSLPTHFGPLGA